jgi:CRISPR-associated endonuclease Cas1 subtype I-B
MEEQGFNWIRFADNIYVFTDSDSVANNIFNDITAKLTQEYLLPINEKKSGVYEAVARRILGYEFYKKGKSIEVRKHSYKPLSSYNNWHESALQRVNQDYHIISGGTLNKKDYSLLFENEDKKYYLPSEVIDQISIYSDVTISPQALSYISAKNIRIAFVDKYGNLQGHYVPEGHVGSAVTLLKQCTLYLDEKEHLRMAKLMEIASLHNIRANLRYYNKKKSNKIIEGAVTYISQCINEINESTTNDGLLLTEARARQTYYRTFNSILSNTDFGFSARSRRPPLDPLNAMISFGNTLLYNKFLQIIWKTSLDPRFGVIHAANNRAHSLNLDFADIFKPILVDRIIFSLVNMKQLQIDADFETRKDGAVYLSKSGKKQFIEHFNQKLADTLVIRGSRMTYQQLIRNEVYSYQRYVTDGEKYKPYKYY